MRLLARTSVLIALLLWPFSALAATPPIVSGVAATVANGKIHVTWREPANPEDIARYRIYYSHESILQNGGAYDDFESTSGNAAEHDLTSVPNASRLYVAVLAVNAAGDESPAFGNEAMVDLAGGQQAQPADGALFTAPTPTPAAAADTLRLLSATSVSGTGVLLTFSMPVAVQQQDAATALRVTDASGAVLAIRTITVQGPTITLSADPQLPGVRYFVRAMAVWSQPSDPGQSGQLVDAQANVAIFIGATPAASTTPTPAPAPTPTPGGGAIGMTVNAQQSGRNTYRVIADLSVPQTMNNQIVAMDVSLSADGGQTYSTPQPLDPTTRQIQLDGMTPGLLVLLARARTTDGNVYQTAPTGIQIDVTAAAAASLAQSRAPLASSGPGLLVLLAASGAAVGWRKLKKQTRKE